MQQTWQTERNNRDLNDFHESNKNHCCLVHTEVSVPRHDWCFQNTNYTKKIMGVKLRSVVTKKLSNSDVTFPVFKVWLKKSNFQIHCKNNRVYNVGYIINTLILLCKDVNICFSTFFAPGTIVHSDKSSVLLSLQLWFKEWASDFYSIYTNFLTQDNMLKCILILTYLSWSSDGPSSSSRTKGSVSSMTRKSLSTNLSEFLR